MATFDQLKAKKSDGNGPPTDITPSQLVQHLITAGRLPFAVVDVPRFDAAGASVGKVYIRLLSMREEDGALANARQYVAGMVKGGEKVDWRPEELEQNARIAEIMSIACRDPDDPAKPFFGSVIDTRELTSDELGTLAITYAGLKSRTHPSISDMSDKECEEWIRVVSDGVLADPFSYLRPEPHQIFSRYCVSALVAARSEIEAMKAVEPSSTGPTPISSLSSE